MRQDQINSMTKHYHEKYGTPTDDRDAIYKLTTIYKELFEEVPAQDIKDGIAEYYRILENRELPAYLWIVECLHITSKKDKSKRTFRYCVGMLRSWMKYGFGHIPNQEEDELAEYFEEVTGFDMDYRARRILQTMMGKYGLVKVTRMISDLKDEPNKSLIMMLQLQMMMTDKYDAPTQTDESNQTVSA